jgi:hypothetical protein
MFVIVTVAPGTTAPLASVMVPLMPPLFVCAKAPITESKITAITRIGRMSFSSRLNQTEHTGALTRLGHPANFRCGNEGNLGMGQKRPDPKRFF